jgi:hypothetical protein
MAEPHIISALRDKRSELAGGMKRMELELVEHRASLTHLDATIRLFDPDMRPQEIRAKQQRTRSVWFHPGECLRLIHGELRDAARPLTTRELADQIMRVKAMTAADERQRELVQETILGSLNRAKETIERIEPAGVVSWQIR